jgi:transposase
MKTKTTSVVLTSPATLVSSGCTLGLDLGDRSHHVCVLDAAGQMVREGALVNTRPALARLLAEFPRATVAVEAGTHSPWISRYLTELGATVLVANPRKLHAISRNERKCDRRDAQMLARLARVDPALLHPIQHGSAQAQHDLLGLKLRDALVRTRVNLINAVRFTLKSLGYPVRNPASESFHKTALADVPSECRSVVQPLLIVLAQVTEQIKGMDRDLVRRGREDYPATQRLQQIAGVGPLTALCFVLKIGDPQRFGRVSGIVPAPRPERRHGQTTAHQQMRRWLAAPAARQRRPLRSRPLRPDLCPARIRPAAHQRWQRPREETRRGRVARKLAVLLLSLWKHGTDYEPRATARPALVLPPA